MPVSSWTCRISINRVQTGHRPFSHGAAFLVGTKMPRLARIADSRSTGTCSMRQVTGPSFSVPSIYGGDKVPGYARRTREDNPALGWRAIRIALDRPALLRYQVRALIAAANGRALDLMLPMVSEVAEFMDRERHDRA